MRSPGRVYTRLELVEALSESGFAGMESTLNVHIRNLRLKVETDPSNPVYLETVFGVGYRMNKQEQS
jgi:DNA-binding response OmpR family regulator